MTWEETIQNIRKQPEFGTLVRDAYFDGDLVANVERFKASGEFIETLALIRSRRPQAKLIADIGSGNGISTLAFALEGYTVVSVEPDPSATIGAGAIRSLVSHYAVANRVTVTERFGEATGLGDSSVDIVYIRQAMHHAHRLSEMMQECYRILRPGGLLLTVRDHVIYDEKDKAWFLESHPLHKFYGGENAYTETQYAGSMKAAGFVSIHVLRFYDSVINYFPQTVADIAKLRAKQRSRLQAGLRKKVGPLAALPFVLSLYRRYKGLDDSLQEQERDVPGRLYTFIAEKL
jgi:SAM-dependent methyltransferase